MRPLLFLIGVLLFFYVIVEAIEGKLQYSFEGWIGTGIYDVAGRFTAMPSITLFMDLVYALTLILSLGMIYIGAKSSRKGD